MKRKALVVLLALAMVLSLAPALSHADGTEISEVAFTIAQPVIGENLSYDAKPAGEGYTVKNATEMFYTNGVYYNDSVDGAIIGEALAKEGHSYKIVIRIVPTGGNSFALSGSSSAVKAAINGKEASVKQYMNKALSEELMISADLGEAAKAGTAAASEIGEIEISVAAPKAGEKPAKGTASGTGYTIYDDTWYTMEDGEMGIMLDGGESFKPGISYCYFVNVKPEEGYTFKDGISAKINGKAATSLEVFQNGAIIRPYFVFEALPEVQKELSSIAITKAPVKTEYLAGDSFNKAGMIVTASYADGSSAAVSDYTISPSGALSEKDTSVTISYTEGGITKTASQAVKVGEALIAEQTKTNPFSDVKEGDAHYDAVLWAYYHDPQVTTGTTATLFSPEMTCTRGQVMTFLWRAAGCPAPTSTANPFVDVLPTSWYKDAVLWAVEKGITNGMDATHFGPNVTCSEAHVRTFIYRAAGSPGASNNPSPWYIDAQDWSYQAGIAKDYWNISIDMKDDCPRARIVNYLYRYYGDK